MPTLNPSKWGEVRKVSQTTHTGARDASTGFGAAQPTSDDTSGGEGIQYKAQSGRGGLSYNIYRSFFYFDTSGNTGTISNVTLNLIGVSAASADVIVVKSTAFGGNGVSAIDNDDFANVTFATPYSSEFTSWTTTTANIAIPLNSTAATDIQNNNYFICAVIEHDHDYSDSDPGTATTKASGVRWSSAGASFTLSFDETVASGPANVSTFKGVAKANISSVKGVSFANIANINGVS
jgi:hypothetical protein